MIETLLQADRLLLVGMLDEAEALYRRSAEADPLNAMAVVGLARVALERGQERVAYQRACDALAIDADDAVALRMEARLSEVLAARGEPVERPAFVGAASAGAAPAAPWPNPPPPESAAGPDIADLAARAERAAASRNPSMADHRDRARREEPPPAGTHQDGDAPAAVSGSEPTAGRKALLRRILGR